MLLDLCGCEYDGLLFGVGRMVYVGGCSFPNDMYMILFLSQDGLFPSATIALLQMDNTYYIPFLPISGPFGGNEYHLHEPIDIGGVLWKYQEDDLV